MQREWNDKILNVTGAGFDDIAMEAFHYQYQYNPLYRDFVDAIGRGQGRVDSPTAIPFLPIRFFKTHRVVAGNFEPQSVFESSGTTGVHTSRHFVKSTGLYRQAFTRCFENFYDAASQWCMLGLLPSYLERKHSSLVFMVDELVKQSNNTGSGFYLHEFDKLFDQITRNEANKEKTLLIGVTFALLDFADYVVAKGRAEPWKYTVIMETGGMKGRREEMIREEIHERLKKAFGVTVIHSEYGMTELLSQAYSTGDGLFRCPQWMKVLIRDENDPLQVDGLHKTFQALRGGINIIDLANIHSCCFIATDDAGLLMTDGSFKVLGRMDGSDLRGCSLLTV